jgi:hypothetical protein
LSRVKITGFVRIRHLDGEQVIRVSTWKLRLQISTGTGTPS